MADQSGLFSIEPVLKVIDVKATAEYYRDVLGRGNKHCIF